MVRVNGGGMGKMLPVVLAKGVLTHSAEILKGLNSAVHAGGDRAPPWN